MTKDDMIQVLRSVGVNENTVVAMSNAFDMGMFNERERCEHILTEWLNGPSSEPEMEHILKDIKSGVRYPCMALPSTPTSTLDCEADQGVPETTTTTTTGESPMSLTIFNPTLNCYVLNPKAFTNVINAFHPDYVKTYMPEFLSSIRTEAQQRANGTINGGKAKASRESVNKGAFTIQTFPKTKAKVKKVDLKVKQFFTYAKAGAPKGEA